MWRDGEIGIANRQTGIVEGTLFVVQENQIKTTWNSTVWEARTVLHVVEATGIGNGASFAMTVICNSETSCISSYDNTSSSLPVSEAPYIQDYTVSATVAAGGLSRTVSYANFRFTHPDATPVTTVSARAPTVRCDAIGNRNTSGCIVQGAEPILDLSTRSVPTLAAHIGYAQASGLPGKPGGDPLTRTTDGATIQNNRNISCNRVPGPRPTGMQCDEYPFASTRNGGGANGPARRYDFSPCNVNQQWAQALPAPPSFYASTGISLCLIPGRDNMRGGGITTWFYTKNRVLDGDTFYVRGN